MGFCFDKRPAGGQFRGKTGVDAPRDPRPKGAQKGVAKRDNGRPSRFTNARNPKRSK